MELVQNFQEFSVKGVYAISPNTQVGGNNECMANGIRPTECGSGELEAAVGGVFSRRRLCSGNIWHGGDKECTSHQMSPARHRDSGGASKCRLIVEIHAIPFRGKSPSFYIGSLECVGTRLSFRGEEALILHARIQEP